MHFTIYKITNKINNKFYIGKHQTNDLNDDYMGSGKLIRRAIQKYGIENFSKEILFIFDNEEDMNNKERELVVISEDSYNLCPGGQGGFGYINANNELKEKVRSIKRTKEYREFQQSITLKQIEKDFSIKIRLRENSKKFSHLGGIAIKEKYPEGTFKGKRHSEETKKKISEVDRTGTKNSQYGTFWITDGKLNKKCKGEIPEGWYKGRM